MASEGDLADAAKATKKVETDEYDLYAWYVADVDSNGNSNYGTSGIAYLGTACLSNETHSLKTSINEWWGPDGNTDTAGTAHVRPFYCTFISGKILTTIYTKIFIIL